MYHISPKKTNFGVIIYYRIEYQLGFSRTFYAKNPVQNVPALHTDLLPLDSDPLFPTL